MIATTSVRRFTPSSRAAFLLVALCVLFALTALAPSHAYGEQQFSITGRGYGHGIGMSQWGAKGYADHGFAYTQILAHYYTGTTVGPATSKFVCVALDDGKDPRSEWRLRAGYAGGRLVVNGVEAPEDVTYTFRPSGATVAVYNGSTLWRTFAAPVYVVGRTDGTEAKTYEEDDPAIAYGGSWVQASGTAWSGGGYAYSYQKGATATLHFSGTSLSITGAKGPAYGQFSISIDGGTPVKVDTYAESATGPTTVYTNTSLAATTHTARITVLAEKSEQSAGNVVILDAIDAADESLVPLVQVVSSSGPSNMSYVRYRGTLDLNLTGDALFLTNTLNIEDYLYGVVPRESPASWPADALKAQAVAARSYAYTETGDALCCTAMSQVYNGHSRTTADRAAVTMHESTTTNAAVDATRSQVVKYGTSVARTYFFSSSGGHTANSEDVWSSALPYLRGVADPYEAAAAPATGWPWAQSWGPAINYTGSALAGKLGYGSAVTALTCDAASTGHVCAVSMTLANGSKVSMTGDRFRSKLGLRSTVFSVACTTLVETGRVEDSSTRFAYVGTWPSATSGAFSGGSYRYSSQTGATVTLRTTATSVAVVGSYGPTYGKAEVWIDDAKAGTIDAYAPMYAHGKVLFSKTGLASGVTHTVVLKALGTRNASSTGATFVFDALDFSGLKVDPRPTPPLETGRVEDASSRVAYSALGWAAQSSSAFSGGTYRYSLKAGATATVRVTATSVGIVGSYGRNYGKAEVFIDGASAGTIDAYASTYAHNQVIFLKSGLTASTHTVVVKALGTKNPSATGTTFIMDAVDCSGAPVDLKPGVTAEAGRVEESEGRIAYGGTWVSVASPAFSGGTYRYSLKSGSTATITTTAGSVAVVGSYGPSYGKAEVFIDGASAGVIDSYAQSYAHSQVLFSQTGLAPGYHTVQVKVLGAKNEGSTGSVFIFDAFDFSGVAVDPAPGETGRIEESSDRVTYAGDWSIQSGAIYSGGSCRYSAWAGRSATIQTTATSIAIVGNYGPTYGKAEVLIDGTSAGVIDAYAPAYAYNQVLFSEDGLEPGNHTVRLVCLGVKDAQSTGNYFILDAFDLSGVAVSAAPTAP